jgi:IPT/TIG domain
MPRVRVVLAVFASLTALVGFAVAPGAAAMTAGRDRPGGHMKPVSSAARGLVATGLSTARRGGPCKGVGFEMWAHGRFQGCTHGPDPAPEGIDVRVPRSISELRAFTPPSSGPGNSVPCVGDGKTGNRVQAVYAHRSDRTDRFNQIAPLVRTWAAEVNDTYNASAAETKGSRQIRFVTASCKVKVLDVALAPSATGTNFSATVDALHNKGLSAKNRKYLVWLDVNVICGVGQFFADSSPGSTNKNNGSTTGMIARIDNGCWGLLTDPTNADPGSVEAHELGHTLGAVQGNAPHHTNLGHCTDEYDVMCYDDDLRPGTFPLRFPCSFLHAMLLDCGHNDYFSTKPPSGSYLATHWNVAKNSFLVSNVAPGNDKFATAQPLAPASSIYAGSTRLATAQSGEPSAAGQGASKSVWYRTQAPSDGQLTVDTLGSSFDTVLGIYTGSTLTGLTEVASGDDNGTAGKTYSRASVAATNGTTYFVKVDGKGGVSGGVMLHVSFGPPGPVITGMSPSSGSPGTSVTVSGSNLPTSSLTMTFDGVAVTSCSSGSSTQLVCAVPTGARTGPIVVRTSETIAISDTNFTIT